MKVSVVMVTYNHERFIRQAIESVLMQETNFDYELVIGEDCSTDSTREIVIEYQRRFPDKVRLLLHDKNQGPNRNFAAAYMTCTGKYVALLEGDDYWISPDKLQKQADFFDNNPEYLIAFHNVVTFWQNSNCPSKLEISSDQADTIGIADILKGFYLPTCSVVLRRALITKFPDWFYALKIGDTPIYTLAMLSTEDGKIKYFPELLGAHRIHTTGIWSSIDDNVRIQQLYAMYNCLNSIMPDKYKEFIKGNIIQCEFAMACCQRLKFEQTRVNTQGSVEKSLVTYIFQLLKYRKLSTLDGLRWLIRLYAPSIYRLAKSVKSGIVQLGAK